MKDKYIIIYCPECLRKYGKQRMLFMCSSDTRGNFACYCKHCKKEVYFER